MDFKSQYKHPMWQKKRLEALEEAEFVCQRCFDGESTLHVHHRQYFKGRMIWEYKTAELEVLCESCHEEAHSEIEEFKHLLSIIPSECIQGIAALVSGFASVASGPIRSAEIGNEISRNNPVEFIAGQVAAAAIDSCSINEIQELKTGLTDLFRSSGLLVLNVSEKKSRFDAFMDGDGFK